MILAVGLILGLPGQATAATPSQEKPYFVVVLVDDLGWTDLGFMGSSYYQTPNIDRVAHEGLVFTNGYAAAAVCSPTRFALQTGRYPARSGITDWIRARFQRGTIGQNAKNPTGYEVLPGRKLACPQNALFMEHEEITVAELLKQAGYATGHIGKWHLGHTAHFPETQGYDVNIGGGNLGQPPSYFDPYRSESPIYEIPNLPPRQTGEYLTDREADEAVNFIRTHKDRPFYLQICHYCVHTPLQAKPEVVERYRQRPTSHHNNPVYAAMIESVDDAVGKIRKALEDCGLMGRTLLIFTSDNGGLIGSTDNRPLRSGKGYPYEGGIRVPWVAWWPGRIEPARCDIPISTIDLLPTLAELAGVPLPDNRPVDGVSLVPILLEKRSLAPRPLFWHFPHYRGDLEPFSIVRMGDWKLIHFYEQDRDELYNLAEDLSETHDLAAQMPKKVAELRALLTRHLSEVDAKLPKLELSTTPGSASNPQ